MHRDDVVHFRGPPLTPRPTDLAAVAIPLKNHQTYPPPRHPVIRRTHLETSKGARRDAGSGRSAVPRDRRSGGARPAHRSARSPLEPDLAVLGRVDVSDQKGRQLVPSGPRHDAPSWGPAHRAPRPQATSPVLYRMGGRVRVADTAASRPSAAARRRVQREMTSDGYPIVAVSDYDASDACLVGTGVCP
jgi:hypothetical protein